IWNICLRDGEVFQVPRDAVRIEEVYVGRSVIVAVPADSDGLPEAINRHIAVDGGQGALGINRTADAESDRVRPTAAGAVAAGRVAVRIGVIDRLAEGAFVVASRRIIAQVVDDDAGKRCSN